MSIFHIQKPKREVVEDESSSESEFSSSSDSEDADKGLF